MKRTRQQLNRAVASRQQAAAASNRPRLTHSEMVFARGTTVAISDDLPAIVERHPMSWQVRRAEQRPGQPVFWVLIFETRDENLACRVYAAQRYRVSLSRWQPRFFTESREKPIKILTDDAPSPHDEGHETARSTPSDEPQGTGN
jgi:hypothetical protein